MNTSGLSMLHTFHRRFVFAKSLKNRLAKGTGDIFLHIFYSTTWKRFNKDGILCIFKQRIDAWKRLDFLKDFTADTERYMPFVFYEPFRILS